MTNTNTNTNTNWHKRFIELAHYIAQWSKYPGRKIGAVIVDDRHTVVSIGYNGSPRGCDDRDESKFTPENKYLYAEHAERNAIYNASRCLVETTIYSTLFPCAACARAIIQVGIRRLVTYQPDFSDASFGEQFIASLKMFDETKVFVSYYNKKIGVIDRYHIPNVDHITNKDYISDKVTNRMKFFTNSLLGIPYNQVIDCETCEWNLIRYSRERCTGCANCSNWLALNTNDK